MLGNVCHRSITSAGGAVFLFGTWAVFFQQKIIEIFTGCDE